MKLVGKINLVIVDDDDFYVDNLSNYLRINQANKFQVNCFTNYNSFQSYLSRPLKIDILLINGKLYKEEIEDKSEATVILLSEGRKGRFENLPSINKYQTGDKIVNQVLNIFAEKSLEPINLNTSMNKKTKIISMYSPIGGVGKTCIALGLSQLCIEQGKTAIYLNLETIQSTPVFFNCSSEINLTHIFYYLKENNMNLKLKIQTSRLCDQVTKIHYFAPPESCREIHELEVEDLNRFLMELRNLEEYDYIFIDMSSELTENNFTVLNNSDEIIFIITPDIMTSIKCSSLVREFEIMGTSSSSIEERIRLVLNKNSGRMSDINGITINERHIQVSNKIPEISSLVLKNEDRYILNLRNDFGSNMAEIMRGLNHNG
jgi:MinD-like ATPase involved in chromosome partitioning or flagellar assembly